MVKSDKSWITKFRDSESSTSVIFGAIVVIVVGILLFNYSRSNPLISDKGEITESVTMISPTGIQLPTTYTVVSGDTLWAIAAKYYGDGAQWTELVRENNITSNGQVEVGQVLRVPVLTVVATPVPSVEPSVPLDTDLPMMVEPNEPQLTTKSHAVVTGDCLWDIAVATYNDGYRWVEIYEANKLVIDNPNLIYPNQVLVLP